VEPPKDINSGDLACNAAMVFAKEAKTNFESPRHLALEICQSLKEFEEVDKVEIAGPRFINIHLKPAIYYKLLKALFQPKPEEYGRVNKNQTRTLGGNVNVEYVSPESHWPDACWTWARRSLWRRACRSIGFFWMPGRPRILY